MPTMNYSNLSIKWNSKYVHSTAPHSAMSTGNEYVQWHKVPLIQIYHKLGLQNITHSMFAVCANHTKTTLTFLNTH